jgi:hypothetical protein
MTSVSTWIATTSVSTEAVHTSPWMYAMTGMGAG